MNKTRWIGLAVILGGLIADQITKYIVKTTMILGEKIVVIPGFFTITSHRNDGAAWGILGGNMIFFYIITVAALGLFYYLLKDADMNKKKFYSFAIFLMVSGGIGNFIDRALYQEVVDFIDVDIFSYTTFPIFNIADICLVVGMILFGIDLVLEEINGKNSRNEDQ